MAISGCSNGLVVTAVVALLLLPAQYYVPDLYASVEDPLMNPEQPDSGPSPAWYDLAYIYLPPLELMVTVTLLCLGLLTYLCEWIQRKLMERRIVKLNEYLGESLERLRTWDAQQEQQEATLKLVQNATTEYNLLLYLLLRQHRCFATHNASKPFYDKSFEEDLNFLRNLTLMTTLRYNKFVSATAVEHTCQMFREILYMSQTERAAGKLSFRPRIRPTKGTYNFKIKIGTQQNEQNE